MRDSGRLWLAIVLGLFLSSTALGDTFPESSYPNFAEDGEFDPAISAPSSVLGYELGARSASPLGPSHEAPGGAGIWPEG